MTLSQKVRALHSCSSTYCTQSAAEVHQKCTRSAPKVRPKCAQSAPKERPKCAESALKVSRKWAQSAAKVQPKCTQVDECSHLKFIKLIQTKVITSFFVQIMSVCFQTLSELEELPVRLQTNWWRHYVTFRPKSKKFPQEQQQQQQKS